MITFGKQLIDEVVVIIDSFLIYTTTKLSIWN